MKNKRIGFGLTGSFCTIAQVIPMMKALTEEGYDVIPIVSSNLQTVNTRFGEAEQFLEKMKESTNNELVTTMIDAERLGPNKPLDALVIAPMTGTSLSKFNQGISDTPVLFSAKATLRNNKPVILAIATNDGLGQNGENIMQLLKTKNIFFVPFTQDDPIHKPHSLVSEFHLITETLSAALLNRQLQPVLAQTKKTNE